MIESYLIYTLLMIYTIVISVLSCKTVRARRLFLSLLVIVFTLVLGLRYNVGTDYMSYKTLYEYQDFSRVEIGYSALNYILYSMRLGYPSIFIVTVFIQIILFLSAANKYNYKLLPYLLFCYFTTLYLFISLNTIRQAIAFSIFLCSIRYIADRTMVKYFVTIFIATLFHKSAVVLFPLYFIVHKNFLPNKYWQILIYCGVFILSGVLLNFIWNNFEVIANIVGYNSYGDHLAVFESLDFSGSGSGLGVYMWIIIDMLILLRYKENYNYTKSPIQVVVYNLFYIGLLLNLITAGTYLDRLNIYFVNFKIFIYASYFYYVLKNRNTIEKAAVFGIMIVLVMFFYAAISNSAAQCSPYNFVSF